LYISFYEQSFIVKKLLIKLIKDKFIKSYQLLNLVIKFPWSDNNCFYNLK
jgi:hypothetical protein